MAESFSLVNLASGEWIEDGSQQEDGVLVVRLAVPRAPIASKERYSGNPADPIRLATAEEIAAYSDAKLSARATATSRQKDKLADCAMSVRTRGIAAWNAMTLAQKKAATLAEADVWRDIRVFIENNL